MKNIILPGLFLLLLNFSFGQSFQPRLLDSLFTSLHSRNAFNGNVLVAERGEVIFEKSYGLADEESQRTLNLQTRFELASVSKQFTAMGIVLLEKKGKLEYDDYVSKYIPELSFYDPVTIRNLLNHTGGLPDYMGLFEEHWDKSKFATNQDIVNMLAHHTPGVVFEPGEKFEYSNTGYALLGLVIEKVSNQSFGQFLADNIFKPLQMENTFVYRSRFEPRSVDNYALGYVADSLGNKVLTDSFGKEYFSYYLDGIVGDGMVSSSLGDLLKWDRALYTTTLVDEKDKELIFSPVITTDNKSTNYGFGWMVINNEKYGKIVNHSGGWAGYLTFIERHLTNDKTIIILQNNALMTTKIPVKEVRSILYNEPLVNEKPVVLSNADLEKYLGVYASAEIPLKITIRSKDGVLYAQATGQGEFPLDSYENHTFKFDQADIKIIFNILENTFTIIQRGNAHTFKKDQD